VPGVGYGTGAGEEFVTVRVLVDLVDGGLATFEGEHYLRKYEFLF
jgi:hypothetical protein